MIHSLLLYSANLRFVLLFSLPPLPHLVYKTIPVSLVLEGLISWITSRNSMQGATLECLYTTSTCSATALKSIFGFKEACPQMNMLFRPGRNVLPGSGRVFQPCTGLRSRFGLWPDRTPCGVLPSSCCVRSRIRPDTYEPLHP